MLLKILNFDEWVAIIETLAMGGIAAALIGVLRSKWKSLKNVEKAQRSLLCYRIVQEHARYKGIGHISAYALQAIQGLYDEYANLGGDGFVTRLMEELKTLPIE